MSKTINKTMSYSHIDTFFSKCRLLPEHMQQSVGKKFLHSIVNPPKANPDSVKSLGPDVVCGLFKFVYRKKNMCNNIQELLHYLPQERLQGMNDTCAHLTTYVDFYLRHQIAPHQLMTMISLELAHMKPHQSDSSNQGQLKSVS